jgi:hypothetical protein
VPIGEVVVLPHDGTANREVNGDKLVQGWYVPKKKPEPVRVPVRVADKVQH